MACLLTVLPLKPRARRYGSEPTNVDYEIQQRFIEWHLVYAPVPFARQTGLPLNRQGTALQVAAALIIEDDVLVRMAAMDAADEVGFVVLGAQNADEALRVLHARSDVLVVVTDINMPGSMDGLALAHFIRNRWPPIEMIIISGRVTPSSQELPERGHFLAKPYVLSELQEMLLTVSRGAPSPS